LNINGKIDTLQKERLISLLQEHNGDFVGDYNDMQETHLNICIDHIYIKDESYPIQQPQHRMNPIQRETVKDELQKLLNVGFIYVIFHSQWVSPLVIFHKRNGKWNICVDYQELKKSTVKDYFPLPFIDQVLDTLAEKKYYFSLMGLTVTIKYAFPLRIKMENISPSHGGTLFINSYLLVFEMHPPLFIRIFLEYFLT
jgi:hypothetical protein